MRKLYVLAILATLLAGACAVPPKTTGSIGVQNYGPENWIIHVIGPEGSVTGTVAANSSTVMDNMKPGVHAISGQNAYHLQLQQWVTVEVGQTAWVNFL